MRAPTAGLAIFLTACAAQQVSPIGASIDHYIYFAPDLRAEARSFESASGVAPVYGGEHKNGTTANYLLSLGEGAYLEIYGAIASPPDSDTAAEFATFAVRTDAIDDAVERLRSAGYDVSDPEAGGRTTPAGDTLSWRTAEITSAEFCDFVPFLIEWGAGVRHPAMTSPRGASVRRFEVRHPDAAALNEIYRALRLGLVATIAAQPGMALTLDSPKGDIVLERKSAPCPSN